jgi:hypothetical protein
VNRPRPAKHRYRAAHPVGQQVAGKGYSGREKVALTASLNKFSRNIAGYFQGLRDRASLSNKSRQDTGRSQIKPLRQLLDFHPNG